MKKKSRRVAEFYTMKDIANILQIDYRIVRQYIVKGDIPCHRITSKIIRIKITDFEDWLKGFAP